MKRSKVVGIVGLLVLLTSGIAWAQVDTGTILGTARDSSGQVLPGVKVTVENQDTGISRTVTTDEGGRYSAPSLSLGNYRVTGSLSGFRTLVRSGIELTVGRDAVVDLSLTVGALTQQVEVTGDAPLVETTSASLGFLVDDRTIRALPLNGRSYDQLALLQPGVILVDTGSLGGNSPFIFGTGKRFSVGGQRDTANSFLLDGTNINDQGNGTPGGAAGTNLGVDTIKEFKIFINSFKAEYGHSNGSVTSAITRSGTNSFHGTAFEYIRNSVLDAMNFFDVGTRPPPFRRNQFGGVLGGPIRKDKTFFFAGYEGLRQGQETTLIATVPTALAKQGILPSGTVPVNPASVPFLNLYPLPNGRDFGDGTGQFSSSPSVITNEDNVMVRVDHQLNAKTGIFARYTYDNDNVNAPLSIPTELVLSASRRQYTTLQANTLLSPKALNNVRFAFNRAYSTYEQTFVPDPGPQVSIVPGQPFGNVAVGSMGSTFAITQLGTTKSGFWLWAYNVLEWGDDFSYTTGKHSFKVGTDIQRLRDNTSNPSTLAGTYTFDSLALFIQGIPSQLQASSPVGVPPYFGIRQSLYGVYGQDDYTVNSRLTLNLGLRWEATTDPYDVNGQMAILPSLSAKATVPSSHWFAISKKNFEPRFGLAWQLDASGKTVLRAGGGIYHDQIFPWAFVNGITQPPFFQKLSLNNPPFPNGYQVIASAPQGLTQLKVMTQLLKAPVNDQYNVSIQRQISASTVVQVSYEGNHSNHLTTLVEKNTPVPTFINGQPFYPKGAPRQNSAFKGIQVIGTNGNSVYNAGTVMVRRQFSRGFEGQIFYTYSKGMDESSAMASADQGRAPAEVLNAFNIAQDWGLSTFNVTHAVVANFSYHLPFRTDSKAFGGIVNGWTLDGIATFTSGEPFTALDTTAVSRDQASSFAERPNLVTGFSTNPIHGVSAGCTGFPAGSPLGGPANWYDPCAFSVPAAGTYGTLGRDTLIGPPLRDVDTAVEKSFKLHEEANLALKVEIFNIFNHPNFGLPNPVALTTSGQGNPSAGVITYTTTSSRQIQFALRFNF